MVLPSLMILLDNEAALYCWVLTLAACLTNSSLPLLLWLLLWLGRRERKVLWTSRLTLTDLLPRAVGLKVTEGLHRVNDRSMISN